MLDLVDLLLLRRSIPADDRKVAFRRIDGNPASSVIYFLPWCTPFAFARQAGFTPLDFLACYEKPTGIVSSEPELCVQAMLGLVSDAEQLLRDREIEARDAVIVGLSVGTYPATYLANRVGARLFSVASADRGDLAIWQSPATRIIKNRAVKKGLSLKHYSRALSPRRKLDRGRSQQRLHDWQERPLRSTRPQARSIASDRNVRARRQRY